MLSTIVDGKAYSLTTHLVEHGGGALFGWMIPLMILTIILSLVAFGFSVAGVVWMHEDFHYKRRKSDDREGWTKWQYVFFVSGIIGVVILAVALITGWIFFGIYVDSLEPYTTESFNAIKTLTVK